MLESVRKRDGSIVSYDGDHIYYAIKKAFISADIEPIDKSLTMLVDEIEKLLVKTRKKLLTIEDIQKIVMRVLKEQVPEVERQYRYYAEQRARRRRSLQVRSKKTQQSTTDKALLVQPISKDELQSFQRGKLYESLVVDYGLATLPASQIASAIEKKLLGMDTTTVSSSLIRALIRDELVERKIQPKKYPQEIIGLPSEDIEQLLTAKVQENANVPTNSPEVIGLAIIEQVQKQYALQHVFSQEVTNAHLVGLIHVHDLGYPTRVYCSSHSPEYIKKFGLNLGLQRVVSKPPKHARTLTGHINTFLATMQAFYAGALGLGFMNIFYSSLTEGMKHEDQVQEAEHLIFSSSQNAFSRGGQTLFLDYNIHTGIPDWMKDVRVVEAGGKYSNRKYGELEKATQEYAHAMLDVWAGGDGAGVPFAFPKCDFHVDASCFEDPERKKVLEHACEVAAKNGSVYFVFDHDAITMSACCRLNIKIKDTSILKHPESIRFCGFQNVTINLPHIALMSKNKEDFKTQLDHAMQLALKAHQEKKRFVAHLMSAPDMPLWEIGKLAMDGKPYVDLRSATYIIGLIGLNEAVQILHGKELHVSEEALTLGVEIILHMKNRVDEFSEKTGLHFALEESPAESAARRLALIDLRTFDRAKDFIRGNVEKGDVYWTNSIHIRPDAEEVNLLQRIQTQALFHPLIESGAITHAFVGEKLPSPKSIYNLVEKTFKLTKTTQLTISPEFVVCNDCGKVALSVADSCPKCQSTNVDHITRIVGYFSRTSGWNRSKLAERSDRHKGDYQACL